MSDGVYFSSPELLWAIPVILALGLVFLWKGKDRILVLSRAVVLSLVVVALANPYMVATYTKETTSPSITILDDRTDSMALFDTGVADRLHERLVNSQVSTFEGNSTPLGDRILQHVSQGNTILLVSDGYSNAGRPLDEALALARASNTTVFAIGMEPRELDASIEITGANTAVMGEDYPFTAVVRSSGTYQGTLSVFADDQPIYTGQVSSNGSSSIKISHAFGSTGTHILKATISADAQDRNNQYQKAVYVVPKPEVLLVSAGPSPLFDILSRLYKLDQAADLPASYSGYKAVVLDNQVYSPGMDSLVPYVRDGGGLVVVGGPDAYEMGSYLNTTLEEALPIRSIPSTFEGGKTVVLVLDISFSMTETRAGNTNLLDYEKSLAIELLKSPDFKDYKVGVVVFGTNAYVVSTPVTLAMGQRLIDDRITNLSPSGTENTYLDNGLQLAWDMLNMSSSGKGEVVVISDGDLSNYPQTFSKSAELIRAMNDTTRLIQVQAFNNPPRARFGELASETGASFTPFTYPQSLTTKTQPLPQANRTPENQSSTGYPLVVLSTNHYITTDISLNSSINGFNDVTPKPGSQRLVIMPDGKPVLTTWRYGLGRVACLTTDDGTAWAPALYAKGSSQLVSATINWAIGDPRPETNRVDAGDGWLGTPLKVTITSNARPDLGPGVAIEKTGTDRYEATLNPGAEGIYYLGDYGIAINYPLEYRDVGFNPDLPRLIMAGGGKVFTEAEAGSSLIDEARRASVRTVQE
ncbi:MAG TPA: VWA domain-containing protein, partial [Methanotrichaceae archaeon]|nr:VWA domain-containing protein [Methanotrichaceae archaeon]